MSVSAIGNGAGLLSACDLALGLWARRSAEFVTLGSAGGDCLYASPSVELILGYAAADFASLSYDGLVHADDAGAFLRARAELAAGGEDVLVAHRVRHQEGAWVPIEGRLVSVDQAGGRLILLIGREASQSHRDEAAQAGAMLARVGHELRSPLNAILGYAELLAGDAGLSPGQAEYARRLREGGEMLLAVIENGFDANAHRVGEVVPVRHPVEPSSPSASPVGERAAGSPVTPFTTSSAGAGIPAAWRDKFVLRIPKAPLPSQACAVRAEAAAGPCLARILVADDVTLTRRLLCDVLSGAGYEVDCVGDGAEALRRVCSARYDLVILDLQMPVMGGLETIGRIRALDGPSQRLPVLAVTGALGSAKIRALRKAGATEWLGKPARRNDLLRSVERLLGADRLDLNWIASLAPQMTRDEVGEIVSDGVEAVARMVEECAACAARGDGEALGRASHDLSATAGALGLVKLSRQAAEIELAWASQDMSSASAGVRALGAAASAEVAALRLRLPGLLTGLFGPVMPQACAGRDLDGRARPVRYGASPAEVVMALEGHAL